MQNAKDTFLMTMSARLAMVNPARTVVVRGAVRTAVIAEDVELLMTQGEFMDCFVLRWMDESVYGAKTGDQKKSAALEIVSAAVKMADAIANKTIVDADGFSSGLGAIIDGVVACLNASLWAKS